MSTGKVILATLVVGILGVGGGLFGYRHLYPEDEQPQLLDLIPHPFQSRAPLPEFSLPDLNGAQVTNRQWAGKVLVLKIGRASCRERVS
jgi:hypothetical protein